MEGSDVFTHTKTIPCWIDANLCAPGLTWQLQKFFSTKLTSSSRVLETDSTKWRFYKLTSLTVFAALLKEVPMGCKK